MKVTKFGKPAAWRAIAAVSASLLALSIGGTAVTTEWSGYINKYLGVSSTKVIAGDGNEDPIHFKSEFSKYTDVMNYARGVAEEVQSEGTVLMTNKNKALPLDKGAKVTFFSYSSVDVALGGTGSGGVSASAERKIDLVKACGNNGKLGMNTVMYDFYKAKLDSGYEAKNGSITRKTDGGFGDSATPVAYQAPEINASEFTKEVTDSFSQYKDAAIFVLTRIGGEGNDLIKTSASENAEKYLALNDDEKSVLQAMKDGPFSKRIVLVNTFNAPELGWLDEYNIDACLYIGGPGEVGLNAVTDVLVGNTNPSGRLADTYAYDSFSSPAMQNFGDFTYANGDSILNSDSRKYLMYNEGIYVGYRYYETRYEDCVLKNGNASSPAGVWASSGNWNYGEEVQFPFGHGLSYSDFTQTLGKVSVSWENKTATIPVTVTNNSFRARKERGRGLRASSVYCGRRGKIRSSAVRIRQDGYDSCKFFRGNNR